jgi:hypothetical protein
MDLVLEGLRDTVALLLILAFGRTAGDSCESCRIGDGGRLAVAVRGSDAGAGFGLGGAEAWYWTLAVT